MFALLQTKMISYVLFLFPTANDKFVYVTLQSLTSECPIGNDNFISNVEDDKMYAIVTWATFASAIINVDL